MSSASSGSALPLALGKAVFEPGSEATTAHIADARWLPAIHETQSNPGERLMAAG
jgi:hypothetical protein